MQADDFYAIFRVTAIHHDWALECSCHTRKMLASFPVIPVSLQLQATAFCPYRSTLNFTCCLLEHSSDQHMCCLPDSMTTLHLSPSLRLSPCLSFSSFLFVWTLLAFDLLGKLRVPFSFRKWKTWSVMYKTCIG